MTDYRVVLRHVKYWRGVIHKWSTVYPFTGSIGGGGVADVAAKMLTMERNVCYGGTTNAPGGCYEVAIYDHASGGVPIYVSTQFDPETPSTWVGYLGGFWSSLTRVTESAAEVSLGVSWLAGLSTSGKPVRFRKWYHAVPVSAASGAGTTDVSTTDATAIRTGITNAIASLAADGIILGSASRLAAASPVVAPYYDNHQMPRGRRRKPLVSGSSSFSSDAQSFLKGFEAALSEGGE